MKRLLLYAATLALVAGAANARTLSPEQALGRLQGNDVRMKIGAKTTTAPKLLSTGTADDGAATYYIFADGQQAMIVGADDLAQPLLGYVDNPEFDVNQMPPVMKWWLSEYSREIAYASARQAAGVKARQKVVDPAQSPVIRRATKTAISPLCATTWGQSAPYNNLCPTKSGKTTYTGCVATAMAQVMKYHAYPSKGVGSNSYTWNNQTLSMNFANTNFDWANMLNTYASSSSGTSAQKTAIATLMKACGYSVNMEYGIDSDGGSGAMSFDIAPALVNNFNYDKATHTEFRDYYSEADWADMMWDNLKNVGPIVYCGASNQGGHCFVCDGYNTSGYFHINWGWSGSYDGYFKLSALNPEGQGIGGYAGGYNTQQDATLGIRKPVSGSVLPESYLAIEGTLKASASSKKITFSATSGGFYNMSSYAATFSVALALKSGTSTQYVGETSLGSVKPGYGAASLALTVPSTVANGSYKASLVYKVGSGAWHPFKYVYGNPNYVNITVGSSSVTIGSTGTDSEQESGSSSGDDSGTTTDEGAITVSSMSSSTGFTIGASAKVTATFKSTYSTSQTISAKAVICSKGTSSYSIVATLATNSVTVSANSTKSSTFTGTVPSTLTAGTYYLIIADADNYILSEVQAIEVKDAAAADDDQPVTGDTYTETLTQDSFSGFTRKYAYYTASSTYANSTIFGYKNAGIQINAGYSGNSNKAGFFANAKSGYVVSKVTIECNFGSKGTNSIDVYTSGSAYSNSTSFKTAPGTKVATFKKGTTSFSFADGVTNFALVPAATGAQVITKITVVYAKGSAAPSQAEAGLAWSAASASAVVGQSFTAPTLSNPNNLSVTYKSSSTKVATISSTGKVTIVGEGSTTITASSAATSAFKAGSASYVLDVEAAASMGDTYTEEITLNSFSTIKRAYSYCQYASTYATTYAFAYKASGIQLNTGNSNNTNKAGIFANAKTGYVVKSVTVDCNYGSKGTLSLNVYTSTSNYTTSTSFKTAPGTLAATLKAGVNKYTFGSGIKHWALVPASTGAMLINKVTVVYAKASSTAAGDGDSAGIDDLQADGNADLQPAVFYNLQGVRVDNPAAGKVYIKVVGNKASKVLVK